MYRRKPKPQPKLADFPADLQALGYVDIMRLC
jgi:hypothetical protein